MSTSLAEQLRRLQTPQSSLFVDTKKRDSILFTTKEAATKSRETIYEIGFSGLEELIDLDPVFEEFQLTLFEFTAKNVQRAVESKEVNTLLDKNIKKFLFHLSPYFMLPASHKCLEWMIRRFNINLYNVEEFLMLILPYHQTKMFVRCIQTMKFDDPLNKWNFLEEVKTSSAPLSKYALWNYGATQPSFLGFVGKFTYEAIKELGAKAGSLQTMINFYCTVVVGALEQVSAVNDNHILFIAKYLVKAYKSEVLDFCAAGYMITAQLFIKAQLGQRLLNELADKFTSVIQPSMSQNVLLLLSLMFQTQSEELQISDKTLTNIMTFRWLPLALEGMKNEGKPFIGFYRSLICKLLEKITNKNEDSELYKIYCENLMAEVALEDDDAQVIIRSILDSYIHVPSVEAEKFKKDFKDSSSDTEEIISLDSDDDDNIPLKSEDVTLWYSSFLKTLERRYPVAFDEVVKNVMCRTPGRRRNGLKNVLGFLLKVSCVNNDTNIFENLYHHNAFIRTEAVTYLVENFNKINLANNESSDILKLTISERLNDENPNVILEVLKIEPSQLLKLVGADELVAKLSKILMRYWKSPEKWNKVRNNALKMLTSDGVFQCTDSNVVLLTVLPFIFPTDKDSHEAYSVVKSSSYAKKMDLFKNLPATVKDPSKVFEILKKSSKRPSSESLLNTIQSILLEKHKIGNISIQFSFALLTLTINQDVTQEFSLNVVKSMKSILLKHKLSLVEGEVTDTTFLASQTIPSTAITSLLKQLILSTEFITRSINFSHQDTETILKLDIFQFLVENFFASDNNQRRQFNEVIKVFLDKICDSDHIQKIEFFSQFCTSHVVHQDNNGSSFELQVRAMRLLNHILTCNTEHTKSYGNEIFHSVLIALTAEHQIVREAAMLILETLNQQQITECWKLLFDELQGRKSEILMDSEQLSYILFLKSSKRSSQHVKMIVEGMTAVIEDTSTFDYVRSSLMVVLKHFTDKKVLEVMSRVTLKLIQSVNIKDTSFDEYKSSVIKLVLMKINQNTIAASWSFVMAALDCDLLLSSDDGKFLTPSLLVLKALDEEVYQKLHQDHRSQIFLKIIKSSMSDQPRIAQAAQKIFQSIPLDWKVIKSIIMKMPALEQHQGGKKKVTPAVVKNPIQTEEWKVGMTLLELLQNKSKGIAGQHELIPVLFEVLDNCLKPSSEPDVEYIRQIVLSLLLNICQAVSPDGKSHRALGIQDGVLKTELVVRCIKESENPQTHHHALLLLAQLALMTPDQVLNDMMTIFTFVGTTLIRHEDSYSFQIISKIIENVVPTLAHGSRGSKDVIPILKIFASIVLQVPHHRRLLLFKKLLMTLDPDNFLWMFIGLVMESHIMNHKKGTVQEEIPERVLVALSIAKDFEVKTIIQAATSLIVYVRELPMSVENERTTNSDEKNAVFSLKTHNDHQLRHFKYIVTQFLSRLLSSPEVKSKVLQLDENQKTEIKGSFQDMILNLLVLIPEMSKMVDTQPLKQLQKSFQAILNNVFDILEATVALLTPETLLVVVGNLILHDFLMVRKKVIELLNRKLEENYFAACDDAKMMKLVVPIKKICDTIGDTNSALECAQQSVLITIKLLAKKLAEENPEEFVEILEQLTDVIDNKNIKTPILINLVICIAELTAVLKVQSIAMLGRFMPAILDLMKIRDDDPAGFLLLHSVASALHRIIETVPLFLSPYLSQLIIQLTRLTTGLKSLADGKVTVTLTKITKIWTTMAQLVPMRVLVPAIDDVYEKILKKRHFTAVEPLMDLLFEIFQNIEGKDVKNYQGDLTDLFLKAMQFRCEVQSSEEISFEEINDVEMCIIKSLVAMSLKLSEGSFRPLFENILTWAIKDEPDNYNRAITFFRLTTEVSAALKSLFLLFSSELLDAAGPLLDKCNPSKNDDESCFGEDEKKNLYLTEFILRTLHNIFLHDHQNFINTQRFDVIMQPIVDEIENEFVLEDVKIQELVQTCTAQLATAASDDILWKQLNYQVLMKTRSENVAQRIFGVKVCVAMAKKLGEDFEPMIPETIPFLSELLEDEDYKVVEACQNGVRELEVTVGESLQKYF